MTPVKVVYLCMLVIGCATKDDGTSDTDDTAIGGQDCDEDGASVYATHCAGCHGTDGTQRSDADLTTGVPLLSDSDLAGVIAEGIDSMPEPSLTLCEEDAVFLFLRETFGEHGGG